MGDTVTIVFREINIQPMVINNVKSVDIKRDSIMITGQGFRKVFFKDTILNIHADYGVSVFIK